VASENVLEVLVRRHVFDSDRPFSAVLDGIFGGISRPDIEALFRELAASTSYEQFSSLVRQAQGSAGLMRFLQLDLDTALTLDPQALIFDEAHLLTHEQLESIRMLTNHDMDSKTPFATVLIGQPTLRRMIKLGVLAAPDQRIAVRYHMSGMTADETGSYIRHHLQLAGRGSDLYSEDAITQIHDAGRGKPRTVNNICVAALIAAYATGKKIVDQTAARAAVSQITSSE
jgi:type II secretory pathway predicted ATPase ExeA